MPAHLEDQPLHFSPESGTAASLFGWEGVEPMNPTTLLLQGLKASVSNSGSSWEYPLQLVTEKWGPCPQDVFEFHYTHCKDKGSSSITAWPEGSLASEPMATCILRLQV